MRFEDSSRDTHLVWRSCCLALALMLALGMRAAESDDRKELLRLSNEWMDAVERKDRVALEAILAHDFQLSSIGDAADGVKRPEWIQNALRMDWQNRGYSNVRIEVHGDVAVVTADYAFQVDPGEWRPAVTAASPVVDVWTRRNGRWQVQRRYLGGSTIERWVHRAVGFLAATALFATLMILRRLRRRRAAPASSQADSLGPL